MRPFIQAQDLRERRLSAHIHNKHNRNNNNNNNNNNDTNNRNQDTSHPLFLQSPTHPSSPSYRNRQVQPPRVGGFNSHAYPPSVSRWASEVVSVGIVMKGAQSDAKNGYEANSVVSGFEALLGGVSAWCRFS